MHADPQVLRDAARMLSKASRQITLVAIGIETRGFVDARCLATARANVDAALARIPSTTIDRPLTHDRRSKRP